MADSLMVADQITSSPPDRFSSAGTSEIRQHSYEQCIKTDLPLQFFSVDVSPPSLNQWVGFERNLVGLTPIRVIPMRGNRRRLSAHHALQEIAASRKAKERANRFREEMDWIENNRDSFAGRWVALLGSQLLSAGASAQEVFQATKSSSSVPLIVYVEGAELPFTGW